MALRRHKCSFKNCLNDKKTSGLRFFHFPCKDPVRSDQWIRNCGNDNLYLRTASQLGDLSVCQIHFKESSFTNALRLKINRSAVPELDVSGAPCVPLAPNAPETLNFPPTKRDESTTGVCCVIGCFGKEVCFYFPKDEVRCRLWLQRCGNPSLYEISKGTLLMKTVCQKHFASHAFTTDERKCLRYDAVPSIFSHNSSVAISDNAVPPQEKHLPTLTNEEPGDISMREYPDPETDPLQEQRLSTLPIAASEEVFMEECNSPVPPIAKNVENPQKICFPHSEASPNASHFQTPNLPAELHSKPKTIVPQDEVKQNINILQPQSNIGKELTVSKKIAKKRRGPVPALCGLPGCKESLYSDSKTVKKLVICSSKCSRYFHLKCTGLKKVEYDILCNSDSLRWFCAECRKKPSEQKSCRLKVLKKSIQLKHEKNS